jgi:hypothetical protein
MTRTSTSRAAWRNSIAVAAWRGVIGVRSCGLVTGRIDAMKWIHRSVPALIVILLVVVVFAPVPGGTRWTRTLEDSGHGPAFACIALLIWVIVRVLPPLQRLAAGREYLIALVAAIVLGALSELAQMLAGRDASLMDWRNDVLGAIAALALLWAFEPQRRERSAAQRGAAVLVAVAIVVLLVTPLALSTLEYQRRDARFPVLADFTGAYDRYFIEQIGTAIEPAPMPAPWSKRDDEQAMLVTFMVVPYPGVGVIEPCADWRAYTSLAVDLTNPADIDLELGLRVHDARHTNEYDDRYNTFVRIPARTRTVLRVALADVRHGPKERLLDLHQVAGVVLFRESGSVEQMYLSRVWLEPATPAVTAR